MQVRDELMSESMVTKYFAVNEDSPISSVYCVDKAAYLEQTLNRVKVQNCIHHWRLARSGCKKDDVMPYSVRTCLGIAGKPRSAGGPAGRDQGVIGLHR